MTQQTTLDNLFTKYIENTSLFRDKTALEIKYTPEDIPHRNKKIQELASILAPTLRGERPSNLFIYGTPGTGKTLVARHVMDELKKAAIKNRKSLCSLYVNCKMRGVADTEYRLLAHISGLLGKRVPATGLPTPEVYKTFFNALREQTGVVLLFLDEIDELVKKAGDDILYNLTRISQGSGGIDVAVVGISNDLSFTDNIDPRVKSSLSEEEIVFPPYNALELRDILQARAVLAFKPGSLSEGAVSKCAALAAQEHGDARRALNLLRVAGELAERENALQVVERQVDMAEAKLDTDHTMEAVRKLPRQSKALLFSILHQSAGREKQIYTGDVFDNYASVCRSAQLNTLTQRRVSDLISELDMLGIISTRVISRGRHGRTRTISLAMPAGVYSRIEEFLSSEFLA